MKLLTNMMCMTCAWRWFVRPENIKNALYRQCPACGSENTREDQE